MRIVESLPRAVREIEHCWIPMSDGCRLAARLWLPADAGSRPVPGILEYLPYGKREGTRERDEPMHRYFAGSGYAAVRVDLRGTGDSDGLLDDEYLEQEHRDGVEVIAWIAGQDWCDGTVGMIGKSWGGFNALQVAALRPPALRGVISVCASDDRYADDAHYMGGCLLTENFRWGATLFTLVAQPPDPALAGRAWRDTWQARLAHAEPFAARWLRHPLRDAYWRHGSVADEFSRIRCPVYAVGGWADGYSNAVPRLLAGLPGPRKGLVGPWGHLYPHEGRPGPAIGFLQEALRWWGACLGGGPGPLPDEPPFRVWMPEAAAARGDRVSPGRWVAEGSWPSPRLEPLRLFLAADGLRRGPGVERSLRTLPEQTTGLAAGAWCGFGHPEDLPGEQSEDDARSLCFDSEPLPERLEILGPPTLRVVLAADRPLALLAARLTDLAPDGSSRLVSYGVLNLTHSADHAHWAPLVPGQSRAWLLELNDVAHAFAPGHRLRLALSSSWWPNVWPSPEPVTLEVRAGAGWLELPRRPPRPEDAALRPFEPPEGAPGPAVVDRHPGGLERRVERNPLTGEVICTTRWDVDEGGQPALSRVEDIELEVGYGVLERARIREGEPLSAQYEVEHTSVLERGAWRAQVRTRHRVTADRDAFRLEAELRASEGAEEICLRSWDERVPRQGG